MNAAAPRLWVGSYADNGGRGLYPITCSASGKWRVGDPFEGARNASFGACSATHGLHYLVDEQGGALGVYRYAGGWSGLASVPTGGAEPCYVALDASGTQLAVANYGSGSIALFSLDPATGLPTGFPIVRANKGGGPHPDRQEGPHAHCAQFSPDQRWLYQVDLGTDEILAFPLESGLSEPKLAFRAPPGSGPRHLLFHPALPTAFLVSELASTVAVLDREGPALRSRQVLSSLPEGYGGKSLGGHIGMNAAGDRLYVTNRGHDSIAAFAFDGDRLSLLQHVPSGGASPRFFLLLEAQRLMLLANEESGNVTVFKVEEDGTLQPTRVDLPIPAAVFIFTGA
jgi:6-phosphogluconolactonase